MLGVGFGIAGATGAPAATYGPAAGFTVTGGLGVGAWAVEARFGLGYSSLPKQDALQGKSTRGDLNLKSLIVRRQLVADSVGVSVFAGIAVASVPLLALGTAEFDGSAVATMDVTGTGVTGGASVHVALGAGIDLVGELAGYAIQWELPGHPYIHPMPAATDMPATLSYTPSTDDIASVPWSATVGIRAAL